MKIFANLAREMWFVDRITILWYRWSGPDLGMVGALGEKFNLKVVGPQAYVLLLLRAKVNYIFLTQNSWWGSIWWGFGQMPTLPMPESGPANGCAQVIGWVFFVMNKNSNKKIAELKAIDVLRFLAIKEKISETVK